MRTYDVFISYAIEDKSDAAEPIARGLAAEGLRVYFVGDELAPGRSVEEVVHHGLEKSEFYILVLSPDYVRKWPIIERSYILHREKKARRKLAFPVWHRISASEVARNFPELLDRYAATTDKGIPILVSSLCAEIKNAYREKRRRIFLKCAVIFTLLALAAFAVVPQLPFADTVMLPSIDEQEAIVKSRIDWYEQTLENDLLKRQAETAGEQIDLDSVRKIYNQYARIGTQSRNDFYFSNGYENISGRKNIEDIGMTLASSPHGAYGLDSSRIWRLDYEETDSTFQQVLAFCDTIDLSFSIDTVFMSDEDSMVHLYVSYHHQLRVVYYTLRYSFIHQKLGQHVRLIGFKPKEEIVLNYHLGSWKIQEVK